MPLSGRARGAAPAGVVAPFFPLRAGNDPDLAVAALKASERRLGEIDAKRLSVALSEEFYGAIQVGLLQAYTESRAHKFPLS